MFEHIKSPQVCNVAMLARPCAREPAQSVLASPEVSRCRQMPFWLLWRRCTAAKGRAVSNGPEPQETGEDPSRTAASAKSLMRKARAHLPAVDFCARERVFFHRIRLAGFFRCSAQRRPCRASALARRGRSARSVRRVCGRFPSIGSAHVITSSHGGPAIWLRGMRIEPDLVEWLDPAVMYAASATNCARESCDPARDGRMCRHGARSGWSRAAWRRTCAARIHDRKGEHHAAP